MSGLLLDLGYSEGAPPTIGPCSGEPTGSARIHRTVYQARSRA